MKPASRSKWIGPGGVVFDEVIHDQAANDKHRHVAWVIAAGTMHRCSGHSVRKVLPHLPNGPDVSTRLPAKPDYTPTHRHAVKSGPRPSVATC